MSSYFFSGLSYLGSAAYNAYYGSESSSAPAETQNRGVGSLQGRVVPSTQSSLPLATYTGPALEIDEGNDLAVRISLVHPQASSRPVVPSLPLTPAAISNGPVHQQLDLDDNARLAEAIRLSEEHARAQVTSSRPQATPSLPVPPVATSNASLAQHVNNEEALQAAIRASLEHPQPNLALLVQPNSAPVTPVGTPVQALTDEQQLEMVLRLSLEESKAADNTHRLAQAQFSGTTSTLSTGKSLEEKEGEAIELAIKRSMSKQQDQYVPMLGKKILVTDIIAEKRSAVEQERPKLALAQNNAKAMKWSLERIERNTTTADQLEPMARVYKYFQPVRGDGNCFYTSFAFDMLLSFSKLTAQQKSDLIAKFAKCNAPQEAREAALAALRSLQAGGSIRGEDKLMLDFVQCLRAIGIQYVQENRVDLEPFLVEPMTYDKLITDLGTMGEDAQEPMIIALVNALDHPIRVVRVTPKVGNVVGTAGSFNYNSPTRQIPVEREPARVVLFTDGHYQLLSKN